MGRLVFAASPTGSASATTQAKYASAENLVVKLRMDAATIRNLPAFTTYNVLTFPDKNNLQFRIETNTSGVYRLALACTSQAQFATTPNFNVSALPANGNDVVLYWQCVFNGGSPVVLLEVYSGAGTLIDSSTQNSVFRPSGFTDPGTGALSFWNVAQAGDFAGLGIYSAALTGSDKHDVPLPGDANVLGVYYFAEGTGSSTADATGGTSLAVTNGTLNSVSDPWDPAGATARFRPYFITG